MDDRSSSREDADQHGGDATPRWRVDRAATHAHLRATGGGAEAAQEIGGRLLYTDERGRQRRLPADMSKLSGPEVAAAAQALSDELGAAKPSYAQIVAIERLNELRAAGRFSEADYLREKSRILGQQ